MGLTNKLHRALFGARPDHKAVASADESRGAEAPIFAGAGGSYESRVGVRNAKKHSQVYAGTEAVDWVYDGLSIWMNAAASAEWHFERNGKRLRLPHEDPEVGVYSGLAPADLVRLCENPNPYQDWSDMMDHLIIDQIITGNAFLFKFRNGENGRPLALYRLNPGNMTAVTDGHKKVAFYELHVDGPSEPLKIKPEDVVHFRQPSPHDDIFGAGIVAGSPVVFDIEIDHAETQAAYFRSGAKLSGVLSTDRTIPEPMIRKLSRQFVAMYTGGRNAYQVAVLERGLQFTPLSDKGAPQTWAELTRLGRERVFHLMRVHPALVAGEASRPGVLEEAQQYFDTRVMRPYLKRFAAKLSRSLTQPGWDVDFVMDYDYVLPERVRLENAVSFAQLPGVRVRETREYMGLPPLGDETDDIVLNLPTESTETDEGNPADRGPGPQGGRPGEGANTANMPKPGEPVPDGAAARRPTGRPGRSGEPTPRDRANARKAVQELLLNAVGMTKAQRAYLPEVLPAGVPETVRELLEEGVRRGYDVEQLWRGVPDEGYAGLEALTDGDARP